MTGRDKATARDSCILDFLNLNDKSYQEADLEKAFISNLQQFLLELRKGFAFVERQQRICFDDDDSNPSQFSGSIWDGCATAPSARSG